MNKQNGFSLVELMIAMTLGLIIIGAVSAMFLTTTQTYGVQDNYARVQENARFALASMEHDIRMAGYRGCLGGKNDTSIPVPVKNNLVGPTQYVNNFAIGLQGFEANGTSWSPVPDTSISGATPAPSPGSDIITIRMATGAGTPLTGVLANGSADIPIASSTGLSVGMNALVADCVASTVFQVTAVNAGPSISHTAGAASNTTADLGRAFGMDASVMPISTVTYYIGASSNAPTGTETSLWQQMNGTGNELVEGVENMQILYGEDTNADLAPDHYVTADKVLNMDNVVAVKLSLLMRTFDDNLSALGQKYTFNGVPNITPPDRRVRRAFNLTISLRNRTN